LWQLWDTGTGKLIEQIPWNQSGGGLKGEPCMLYAAGFSRVRARRANNSCAPSAPSLISHSESQDEGGKFIGAGGSGANEAKVFDRTKGNAVSNLFHERHTIHQDSFCCFV
jgi:hypothetical protein